MMKRKSPQPKIGLRSKNPMLSASNNIIHENQNECSFNLSDDQEDHKLSATKKLLASPEVAASKTVSSADRFNSKQFKKNFDYPRRKSNQQQKIVQFQDKGKSPPRNTQSNDQFLKQLQMQNQNLQQQLNSIINGRTSSRSKSAQKPSVPNYNFTSIENQENSRIKLKDQSKQFKAPPRDNSYKKKIIKQFGRRDSTPPRGTSATQQGSTSHRIIPSSSTSTSAQRPIKSIKRLQQSSSLSPQRSQIPLPHQQQNISQLLPQPPQSNPLTISQFDKSSSSKALQHQSLQLRLSGATKAIKSLQTSNRQKDDLIQAMRQQLQRKSRMLQASQSQSQTANHMQRGQHVNSSINLLMRKRQKELEVKLKDNEKQLGNSKRHMMRVQELNSKLLQKMKVDSEQSSAMDQETRRIRGQMMVMQEQLNILTNQNQMLQKLIKDKEDYAEEKEQQANFWRGKFERMVEAVKRVESSTSQLFEAQTLFFDKAKQHQ